MIFVETKLYADTLGSLLGQKGITATTIHGDRIQRDRELAIRDFKVFLTSLVLTFFSSKRSKMFIFQQGKHHVLVATNVAARGLDIPDIQVVINFDMPKEIGEYVHR